jgi:hypothetical protein
VITQDLTPPFLGTETEKVITRKEYRQLKDARKILVKGLAIEEK